MSKSSLSYKKSIVNKASTVNLRFKQKGAALVLTAFSAIALLLTVGLAVDSGIGYSVRAKLNSATDAAAIAAARALPQGQTIAGEIGEKFFYANYPQGYFGTTPTLNSLTFSTEDDDSILVNVDASATIPTYFMRLGGTMNYGVASVTEVIRRDLDMILVLDTSGSINSPSDTPEKLKNAAISFINKFVDTDGGDRVGLVVYASGAVVNMPINKTSTRGFNKTQMANNINSLSFSGATASAEALRVALNELNAIPAEIRSSLRIIVFFSDGAPNIVAATYATGAGNMTTGLYSETTPGGAPNRLFNHDSRNSRPTPNTATISQLPATGVGNIATTSFNNARTLTPSAGTANSNNRCNINKAARNMTENMGNNIRTPGIRLYSLGLGDRLNDLEVDFCGYDNSDFGANILKRVANTTDVIGHIDNQPTGLYVYAEDADELNNAFSTIASEILRLTK